MDSLLAKEDIVYVECSVELEDKAGKRIRIEGELPDYVCEYLKSSKYFTTFMISDTVLYIAAAKTVDDINTLIMYSALFDNILKKVYSVLGVGGGSEDKS